MWTCRSCFRKKDELIWVAKDRTVFKYKWSLYKVQVYAVIKIFAFCSYPCMFNFIALFFFFFYDYQKQLKSKGTLEQSSMVLARLLPSAPRAAELQKSMLSRQCLAKWNSIWWFYVDKDNCFITQFYEWKVSELILEGTGKGVFCPSATKAVNITTGCWDSGAGMSTGGVG